jgi:aryl-alcohol dehydrogenase-like predicted oxidoreductase
MQHAKCCARQFGSQAQIALAWLLERSPAMLPIPGTGSLEHLRENLDAASIELSEDGLRQLSLAKLLAPYQSMTTAGSSPTTQPS